MRLVRTDTTKETPTTTKEPTRELPGPARQKKKHKKHKKDKKNKENRAKSEEEPVENKEATSFQRKRDDGSTSLAILTPGEGVVPGTERDRPVTLGMLLGRVRAGTASLATFREDRRNVAKPMYPIYYSGYSSHGPTYDSTFANMTESESVMVGPYFDKRSQENEELIRAVCGSDYSITFVDHILDLFSGKEVHDIVAKDGSSKVENKTEKLDRDGIDFDCLKTLEQDGIDMSFMSTLQAAYELRQEQEMKDLSLEEQLELTAQLIDSLASAQTARLSAPPPPSLTLVPPPGPRETRLAGRVLAGLGTMTGRARPEAVVQIEEVRRAMGVEAPSPGDAIMTVSTVREEEEEAKVEDTKEEDVMTNGEAEEKLTNGVEKHIGDQEPEPMDCA
jgi:bromodomain-containing protein 7/9